MTDEQSPAPLGRAIVPDGEPFAGLSVKLAGLLRRRGGIQSNHQLSHTPNRTILAIDGFGKERLRAIRTVVPFVLGDACCRAIELPSQDDTDTDPIAAIKRRRVLAAQSWETARSKDWDRYDLPMAWAVWAGDHAGADIDALIAEVERLRELLPAALACATCGEVYEWREEQSVCLHELIPRPLAT